MQAAYPEVLKFRKKRAVLVRIECRGDTESSRTQNVSQRGFSHVIQKCKPCNSALIKFEQHAETHPPGGLI